MADSQTPTTLDLSFVMTLIEKHEGRRLRVYKDTRGIATIGVGFNLEAEGAREIIESLGIDYGKLLEGLISLTDVQVDHLFAHSFANAVQTTKHNVPFFDEVPAPGQAALVDLVFDLDHRITLFKKALNLLESEHYIESAAEFKNSAFYHEAPERVTDDCKLIEQCAEVMKDEPEPAE